MTLLWTASLATSSRRILQVTVFARSGARANYKKIPGMNLISKYGKGGLTGVGMRQQFLLGKDIRRRYSDLIQPSLIKQSEIEVITSQVERSQQSAISMMQGFFSPGTGESISTEENFWWSPPYIHLDIDLPLGNNSLPEALKVVPLKSDSQNLDFMFIPDFAKVCTGGAILEQKFRENIYHENKKNFEIFGQTLIKAGFISKDIYSQDHWNVNSLYNFADDMICYKYYYGKLYPGLTDELMEKIESFMGYRTALDMHDYKYSIVRSHGIAKNIIEGLKTVRTGKKPKKLRVVLGHDTNILSHMLLLKMTTVDCLKSTFNLNAHQSSCHAYPSFASQFIYEVSQADDMAIEARLMYNGMPVKICEDTSSDEYCDIDKFIDTIDRLLTMSENAFEKICMNRYIDNNKTWIRRRIDQAQEISGFSSMVFYSILAGAMINFGMLVAVVAKAKQLRRKMKIINNDPMVV